MAREPAARELLGRVQFVTRAGCHLCDEVLVVVRRVAADAGLPDVELLDVDADPELHRRFTDQVPVVLVDGQVREVLVRGVRGVDEDHVRRAMMAGALTVGALTAGTARRRWWRRG